MKLTKKLETEIKVLMDDYWDSYFKGDLKHWAKYLLNDYRNIGGTEEEIWNSKKEILDYTKRIIDQIIGHAEIRNKKTEIITYDPYIMAHEFMDLFIKVEGEWTFYGKFRLSSLIQKISGEWKVLHQHGSYPDSHTEQGEAFAFDKLRKENTQLRDEVKRRTIELENQNRELEIETALEKVRSSALAMKQPADMLDVCRIISDQLQYLGVNEIRNVQTAIINDERGTYLNYEYFTQYKTTSILEIETKLHPIVEEFANEIKKSSDACFTKTFEGVALKDWREYRRKTNQNADPILDKAISVHYYFYSIGPGALGVSTYTPLSEEDAAVFKRFRNVFDLAYRRFMDIQKAEAQAREAQIELGLERVRARAMAMQRSEELKELIGTVFTELTKLDLALTRCLIMIYDTKTKGSTWWMANSEAPDDPIGLFVQNHEHPPYLAYLNAWEEKNLRWQYILEGAVKKDWDDFLFVETELSQLPDFVITGMKAPDRVYLSASFNNFGNLTLATLESLSEEHSDILLRFAKVFDLTYTRFNDLKLAEAQTREAQIETALEKIRSRTLAMQKSDELAETASEVFKQMIGLGVEPNRLYIGTIKDESGNIELWVTNEDGSKVDTQFTGNIKKSTIIAKMYNGWKEKKKSLIIDLQGKELTDYFHYLQELNVPFKLGLQQKRRAQNIAYFSKGFIGVASPEPQPEEIMMLLERFAGVFNLTYTRFFDLKNAEEQNKIIQVENERKSKELEEARLLQLAMLPKELPQLPNIEIAVYMKTATEIGGDYYDFHTSNDGTLTTVVGDATGHGMKAGTMVTITKSLFNSFASDENILDTYSKISHVIKEMKFRQLSMCLLMLKIKGREVTISSAAMPPVLIYRKKNKSIEEIFINGMPLGSMTNFPYSIEKRELEKGDTILLFSDGLPELKNEAEEMYGYQRTRKEFKSVGEETPEVIIEHLKKSASTWANGKEADDDVTFVVIKIK